ncbi:aromatic-ring hydroxylase C-terminal domain-containing protein [Nocardia abscessus]|uniref:aromatic-ring hydroxylase C-terminal domain-containing protein n=1 Tax=Nocardia abscessus TaxID=120957 RepID=UPI0034D6742D
MRLREEVTHSWPLSTSATGALRQGPRFAAQSPAEARSCGNRGRAKHVLRPDGHVAWVAADQQDLLSMLAKWFGADVS